ncbi:MAG: 4-(cytidine 5'-diphospho)-2-C-methyl-D-erythritol kinase [Mangrovibacterium sp.]
MISYPIAKINLGLKITGKRNDGFHNLETIFYPVPLHDALEVTESGLHEFSVSGLPVEGDSAQNLVVRAYELLKKDYGLPSVRIHLHKHIPTGAGLGGGSSDAASMLLLLNSLFRLKIGRGKLMDYALSLGSDCPFFLIGKPVFAMGRGELMEELALCLDAYYLILVKPPVQLSTAEAYAHIEPRASRFSMKGLAGFPVNRWKGNIQNQFEPYAFEMYPELEQIKQTLYDQGASFALMSGSGSCVYGLFHSAKTGLEKAFPETYRIYRLHL